LAAQAVPEASKQSELLRFNPRMEPVQSGDKSPQSEPLSTEFLAALSNRVPIPACFHWPFSMLPSFPKVM
jgi:hypothetical protein